jgi:phasin family protein
MNHAADTSSVFHMPESAMDALLSISHICLDSSERLIALNSSVAKQAIADGATMARAVVGMTPATALHEIREDLAGPILEKALAYQHDLREITAQAQDELAHLMADAYRTQEVDLPMPGPWLDLLPSLTEPSLKAKAHGARNRAAEHKSA